MSREKQIEEMAEILRFGDCIDAGITECRKFDDCNVCKATRLYNAGYRKQEWISVDERLPEEDGRYLVFYKEPRCDNTSATFFRVGEKYYEYMWKRHYSHWMPLPESPKMKGGTE